ncbi:MAG TPA: flavodoxin-dependent (E)-4-hydroxy-3-methylbut-2-enyl-diphosphate synthase [Halanaerobiales bacterium]|nr:flavodoxin-dependent (E)-4-hydroxy-3-methylbut-2-enyl-diphosphate synthase [Halanaerobiales bacterium]
MHRRKTKKVFFADVAVGGDSPISIQSMTNTKTTDVKNTVKQIHKLEKAGCELIRVAIPDIESAKKIKDIKEKISIPLIADIHFDYRLALKAIESGVDGLRLNPGNIGSKERVEKVVKKAKSANIPIRVGVNSGSIEKRLLKKYGHPTAEAMVESALNQIKILEDNNFEDIIISLKSTDIWMTIKAYKLMAKKRDYPFHIGITEAGTPKKGVVKSAVGIGSLLTLGLGDTLRVSLTGDPIKEVETSWHILESLDIRQKGIKIISCPTCGRTNIDLTTLVEKVEKKLEGIELPITVAVMGCEVNGPGEAKEADIGIAGGRKQGIIFKKGKKIKTVKEKNLLDALMTEIDKIRSDFNENV